MPELPEVEVLVRQLAPLLKGRIIRSVAVHRKKVLRPVSPVAFSRHVSGARFLGVERRAKYLVFRLRKAAGQQRRKTLGGAAPSQPDFGLLGHLGMTGRMYVQPAGAPLPRHAAVSFDLGRWRFVFEDTRYFGRLTTDLTALNQLGPEPLGAGFTIPGFTDALRRSRQAIKVRIMDQSMVAGVGNIYASEALFRAGVPPWKAARRLSRSQIARLHSAIVRVLHEAIECGSTLPLDFSGKGSRDGLFYYGTREGESVFYQERLQVYDRAGQPCVTCGTPIKRIVQAARSTYFCPKCQRG